MKFKSRATGDVLHIADSQAKTIRHIIMSGRYEVLHNDEWNESDHPRGENGQFTGGGSSGSMSKQEMEHNLDRYKKNIKWMESDPKYQHGRKLRELEEYRQGYRELRAQYEKEFGGSSGGKSRDFGSEVKQHESKIAELESRLKTEEPNSSQHERTKSAIRDLKRQINNIKKVEGGNKEKSEQPSSAA